MDKQTGWVLTDWYFACAPLVDHVRRATAARHALSWHDQQDVEQELWLAVVEWWRCSDNGQPPASSNADLATMLARAADQLVVRRAADAMLAGAPERTSETLPPAASANRPRIGALHLTANDPARLIDLRLDVDELIARLPLDERTHCDRIIAGLPSAAPDVALRATFEAHGFRDYL